MLTIALCSALAMINKSGCTPGGRLTPEQGERAPSATVGFGMLGIAGFVFLIVAAAVVTPICDEKHLHRNIGAVNANRTRGNRLRAIEGSSDLAAGRLRRL
ncbi:hypothetical protein [Kitasatospora sp. NPDC015120]|uniref:hypothetical protein n=1 Tax=Kitasatospora sp. NPDC015120 TaxID=3364023 RepID=UPI0036F48A6C